MSELAFNVNGERFDLPEEASHWRVRRFKPSGRGTPEVVFGDSGLPLIIPIDTDIAEFRAAVRNAPGRYRLDAVDDGHRSCEDAIGAYVQLSADAGDVKQPAAEDRREGDELLREIVRANADMVKTIAEKFATVMDSAAGLLRAADGAGMPARVPREWSAQLAGAWRNAAGSTAAADTTPTAIDDEDEDDAGSDSTGQLVRVIENVASQAMPLVKHHIHTKFMGLTPEQSLAMLGGPAGLAQEGQRTSSPATAAQKETAATAEATPAPPDFFAHLAAIEARLTAEESALAKQAIQHLPPDALASWKSQILAMTADEAAAVVRAECKRLSSLGAEAEEASPQTEAA